VIEQGVTGFIVNGEGEALQAIKRLPEIDRRHARDGFERRFTARRMAQDYIRYDQLLSKYPPAKPGALMIEPLKAAWRGQRHFPSSNDRNAKQSP
jgi:hypothetical protein